MAKKETNPVIKQMIDYFHDWFSWTHGFNFTWIPKEVGQVKNLYNCIATYLQGQGKANGETEVFALFERMLFYLQVLKTAKWYYDHAAPSNLVSKFNDVMSVIQAEAQKAQARRPTEPTDLPFDE